MTVIPAIDILRGRVVRLVHGDFSQATRYENDPSAVVERFAVAGARRIHVVDLDAARGRPEISSRTALNAVLIAVSRHGVEVEVGGGVRDELTARRWIDAGATYVVLGSVFVRDAAAAEAICRALPGRCLLGLDVRDGVPQAQGWTEGSGDEATLLGRSAQWPVAGVIRTDVGRDGALTGPDVDGLAAAAAATPHPVIASGGIRDAADIAACQGAGCAGAVVGRALYEGGVDLAALLSRFAEAGR